MSGLLLEDSDLFTKLLGVGGQYLRCWNMFRSDKQSYLSLGGSSVPAPEKATEKLLIWDLPTRVFHWSLVLAFSAAWLTSLSDRFLFHHVYAGYVFIGLLLFRLVWGVVGSHYARFRSFAHDWSSVSEYLKGLMTGQAARYVGHNPAGSYAIFAMLVLGVFVSVSGLMVLGGEEGHGPFKGIVSFDVGVASKGVHEIAAITMLLVAGFHFSGVVFESVFHKENLIWAMITGYKPVHKEAQRVNVHALIAVVMLGGIFGSGVYYFYGVITQTEDKPFLAFKGAPLPDNDTWRSECGDCHLAFHPSLLPARSWQRMMEQQEEHFEEDLALDEETIDEIRVFLTENSSEKGLTEFARWITREVPANEVPMRITEINYWQRKHKDINEAYWSSSLVGSKANCSACHRDAEQGWFEDSNMVLPKLSKGSE